MNKKILGIDLGGTNLRGGVVEENNLSGITSQKINASGSVEDVLRQVFRFIDKLISPEIKAIGIGVPGLVVNGIVYDAMNIPSWKEISLQKLMEERYRIPVAINNDANCFALGEFYFGEGKGFDSVIGLTVGTGLGSGIIINKKLYSGNNCGAGEFGMIDYMDHCYEYYASGQFFQNVHNMSGEVVFEKALQGDRTCIKMYEEFGFHLGNAIKAILYATDVSLIVLGGSVSKAFSFFSPTMFKQMESFVYKRALQHLQIKVSNLQHSGILGAAALCMNHDTNKTVIG